MVFIGLIAMVAIIYGVFKGLKWSFKKVDKTEKMPHLKKAAIIIIAGFLTLVVVPIDKVEPKPDSEIYQTFYSEIMTRTAAVDALYRPFGDALGKSDIFGATKEALRVKQEIQFKWTDISSMEVPELKNKEAHKTLIEAKNAISRAYMHKVEIVENFLEFAESQNMTKLAEVTNSAENIAPLMLVGLAHLTSAGDMVGVKAADLVKK